MKKVMPNTLARYIHRFFVLLGALFMLCVCIAVTISFSAWYFRNSAYQISQNLIELRDNFDARLQEYGQVLRWVAENPDIYERMGKSRSLDAATENTVQTMLLNRDRSTFLHILSKDTPFRFSTGSIPNIYSLPVYQNYGIFRSMNATRDVVLHATGYPSYNGKRVALSIGLKIARAAGEPEGYVIIDIARDELESMLILRNAVFATEMTLVGQDNVVAYSNNRQIREGVTLKDATYVSMLSVNYPDTTAHVARDWLRYYVLPLGHGGMTLIVKVSNQLLYNVYIAIALMICAMLLFLWIGSRISAHILSKKINTQIKKLMRVIRKSSTDHGVSHYMLDGDFYEFEQLGLFINDTNIKTGTLMRDIEEKQVRLVNAELSMLKAQIDPHFIYNALNNIKSLAKLNRNADLIEMVIVLSSILRTSLSERSEYWTLHEEIELISNYIRMHNFSSAEPIDLRLFIAPELMDIMIPSLILQPLVENSVVHGLALRKRPIICIRGHVSENGGMVLKIIDNGMGIAASGTDQSKTHGGIGLPNVAKRIKLHFGDRGTLQIKSVKNRYTVITIQCEKGNSAESLNDLCRISDGLTAAE